jgi:hypothetical protein
VYLIWYIILAAEGGTTRKSTAVRSIRNIFGEHTGGPESDCKYHIITGNTSPISLELALNERSRRTGTAMTEMTSQLLDRLNEMSTETAQPLEKRLVDMAVWFHKNKDRMPRNNVEARCDFLMKSLDIHLELVALLVQRLELAEGRRGSPLWLPAGIKNNDTGEVFR